MASSAYTHRYLLGARADHNGSGRGLAGGRTAYKGVIRRVPFTHGDCTRETSAAILAPWVGFQPRTFGL